MAKKIMKDIKLLDPEPSKCKHDPTAPDSSLLFMRNFQTMVYPKHYYAYCQYCGGSFEYEEDKHGKLILIEEEEDE